jgi:hypothetical protein
MNAGSKKLEIKDLNLIDKMRKSTPFRRHLSEHLHRLPNDHLSAYDEDGEPI